MYIKKKYYLCGLYAKCVGKYHDEITDHLHNTASVEHPVCTTPLVRAFGVGERCVGGESIGIFVDRSRFAPSDKRDMLDDNLLVSVVLHSVLVRTVGVYQANIQRYQDQRDSA